MKLKIETFNEQSSTVTNTCNEYLVDFNVDNAKKHLILQNLFISSESIRYETEFFCWFEVRGINLYASTIF